MQSRQTITHGEVAAMSGLATQGLGKVVDVIKAEEAGRQRPDPGCLVVTVRTGLPGELKPGQDARERAIAVQEAVFRAWGGQD